MTSESQYLAEKAKIETNILKPIREILAGELGPDAAKSLLAESLKNHAEHPSPSPFEGQTPVTILAQRHIEIDLIQFVYQSIRDKHGLELAKRLIGQAVINDARAAGRQKAALTSGPANLLTFAEILPQWSSGGALVMTVMESSPDILRYVVHNCRYAEMYKEMGLLKLGFLVSCGRDGAFMEGYAPNVSLERKKTIMTGDRTCEFCYRAKARAQNR
jgi:hypothetical protein